MIRITHPETPPPPACRTLYVQQTATPDSTAIVSKIHPDNQPHNCNKHNITIARQMRIQKTAQTSHLRQHKPMTLTCT